MKKKDYYQVQTYKNWFGDVPLEHAILAWNDRAPHGDGKFAVIPHPDTDRWINKFDFSNTLLACESRWSRLTTKQRLSSLIDLAWRLSAVEGHSMSEIHEAIFVIPEYRKHFDLE